MTDEDRTAQREAEQSMIDYAPIITIPSITTLPPIGTLNNPTAKHVLQVTKWLHWQVTRNNTPGIVPLPTLIIPIPPQQVRLAKQMAKMNTLPFNQSHLFIAPPTPGVRNWGAQPTWVQPSRLTTKAMVINVPSVAQQRIVTRHAINVLTLQEKAPFNAIHVPTKLMHEASIPVKFEHYANPMVHLVTGKTISSYKQLMNNPATAEVWQTAFGKDFGSMAQGNNKTGQRGMKAMFVMTHNEVAHALATG